MLVTLTQDVVSSDPLEKPHHTGAIAFCWCCGPGLRDRGMTPFEPGLVPDLAALGRGPARRRLPLASAAQPRPKIRPWLQEITSRNPPAGFIGVGTRLSALLVPPGPADRGVWPSQCAPGSETLACCGVRGSGVIAATS